MEIGIRRFLVCLLIPNKDSQLETTKLYCGKNV